MAELLRIEPTKSHLTGEPDGYGWFVFDDGRSFHRKLERDAPTARSDFPTPLIIRDFDQPVRSMADGNFYSSKAALERTYRADGNPQGVAYECVGEKVAEPYKRPPRDKMKAREAVDRALHDMGMGI